MVVLLVIAAVWAALALGAVALCVAARRIDEDIAAGRRPVRRGTVRGAPRFAHSSLG